MLSSYVDGYWFKSAPLFNLDVVRIILCATILFQITLFSDYHGKIDETEALPPELFRPIFLLKILHLPLGWGFSETGVWAVQISPAFVHGMLSLCIVSGGLALLGVFTRFALFIFACTFFYVQGYLYSFGDFHHSEAIGCIALFALAFSPVGRAISVDRLRVVHRTGEPLFGVDEYSPFAGWALIFIQWFFVAMYWSAVASKLGSGGLDWANGYTLQYYLARDGLRWESDLALWLSQHHTLVQFGQIGVILFQSFFFMAVLFPVLRWLAVPAGLTLHISIYLTLTAPFFIWIALYSVFIPWSEAMRLLRSHTRSWMADSV